MLIHDLKSCIRLVTGRQTDNLDKRSSALLKPRGLWLLIA